MAEIEKNMQTQKRGENYQTTGNLLFALYDHFLSRPVEQKLENGQTVFTPDPHMHSHAFVFNVTYALQSDRFQSIEVGNIKADGPYYEAIYHAHLRQAVLKAGYDIEFTKDRWELKCVPKATRDKFSNRTQEIESEAKEKNIRLAEFKAQLGARTRNNKNKSAEEDQVTRHWHDRLSTTENFNIQVAMKNESMLTEKRKQEELKGLTADRAVDLSLQHFMERKSAISEKRVLGEALNSGLHTPEEIHQAYQKREDIIGYENNTRRIITTRDNLQEEQKMITYAAQGKDTKPALNPTYEPQRDYLNEGQKQAIQKVLSSQDQVQMVVGDAGVGKTTMMLEIRDGIQQSGKQFVPLLPVPRPPNSCAKKALMPIPSKNSRIVWSSSKNSKIKPSWSMKPDWSPSRT